MPLVPEVVIPPLRVSAPPAKGNTPAGVEAPPFIPLPTLRVKVPPVGLAMLITRSLLPAEALTYCRLEPVPRLMTLTPPTAGLPREFAVLLPAFWMLLMTSVPVATFVAPVKVFAPSRFRLPEPL